MTTVKAHTVSTSWRWPTCCRPGHLRCLRSSPIAYGTGTRLLHGPLLLSEYQSSRLIRAKAINGSGSSSHSHARRDSTPSAPISTLKKALAIDYGNVWTGVAIRQGGGNNPLQVLRNSESSATLAQEVLALAAAKGCDGIIVGVPVQRDQLLADWKRDSAQSRRCRNFANTLALAALKYQDLPVFIYSEFRSSAAAHKLLDLGRDAGRADKMAKQLDAWAAAMILGDYYSRPGRALRVRVRLGQQQQQQEEEE